MNSRPSDREANTLFTAAFQPFYLSGRYHFSNFGRVSPKEHFYETLEIGHWPWLEMSFKGFPIFSSGGHFVHRSKTILAIKVQGHTRKISVTLFWNWAIGLGIDAVKDFISIFSCSSHLVYRSGTILAIILVGSHLDIIPVKPEPNWSKSLGGVRNFS